MGNIYLVTEGAYSDYHVVCAFSTEHAADEWAKQRNALRRDPDDDYGTYQVEEFELLDGPPPIRTYWTATFWHYEPSVYRPQGADEISQPQRVALDPEETMPAMGVRGGRFYLSARALTKDECWQMLTNFLTEKFGDKWKDAVTQRT